MIWKCTSKTKECTDAQVPTEGLPMKFVLRYESYYDGDSEGNTGLEVQNVAATLNSVLK